ncbi:MAG: tRNA (adenosine(37)-N6)-threonylcarbamoyltransferase complex dimerization subunit type 1 TsaB [Bacteroidales bacterium]|jgi:tRNA threonylcarbamoyladenosine biosynthesis protein TsaB|nr:tRNA (adenosine(37)-N6)-threonylcarbamoyltransferase complex dimerization subunit type 1 TsaB [Bacteroidales bacterium]
MAMILNIETSTQVCSVSVSENGHVKGYREINDEKSHAKYLTVLIEELLNELTLSFGRLDAVAVSKGPGSYTGLRIGVSTAKGLCYAKNLPLISVNTLQSMAFGLLRKVKKGSLSVPDPEKSLLVPMIDARRMEVYSALFNAEGEFIREVRAEIIDRDSYQELLASRPMIFFGNGSEKLTATVQHPNAFFLPGYCTSAVDMAELSEQSYSLRKFEDVAYFEPFYLKDFIATKPRKNIFK